MTTQHTTYDPTTDAVDVRDAVGERDGFFTVSLPVSSDTRARDGEAFDTDRLRGFAQQINNDRTVPVFLSHGRSELSEERYGALGKVGRVTNGDVETRDGTNLLTADLEIANPDDLADEGDTGDVETALRWVRQQFHLGLGSVSVGWTEDTNGRDVPGDAELLEVSVVGIESDTQAQQAAAEPTEAAVRGFEALPSDEHPEHDEDTLPEIDMNGWDEATDRERVEDALDTLQDYTTRLEKRASAGGRARSRGPQPAAAPAVDEICRQLGHGKPPMNTAERIEELRDADAYDVQLRQQREDVLARLDTIAEHRGEHTSVNATGDPVEGAVETVRNLLADADDDGDDAGSPGWYE